MSEPLARLTRVKSTLSAAEARRIALAAQGFARPRPATAGTRQLNLALGAHGDAADRLGQRLRPLALHAAVLARRRVRHRRARPPAVRAAIARTSSTGRTSPRSSPPTDWALFRFRMDDDAREVRHEARRLVRHRIARSSTGCAPSSPTAGPLRPAQIEHDAKKGARGPVVGLGRRQARARVPVAVRRGRDRRPPRIRATLRPRRAGDPRARCSTRPVPRDDAIRELVRRAARAYGVATASDLADYWRIADRQAVMAAIGDLDGRRRAAPGARSRAGPARAAPRRPGCTRDAVVPRRVDAAAILTPFDPVVWFRDRAERLFDFEYRIEIYTPAPKRRFGYYSLPVLVGDDIVGRVDLKADRARVDAAACSRRGGSTDDPRMPRRASPTSCGSPRAGRGWSRSRSRGGAMPSTTSPA